MPLIRLTEDGPLGSAGTEVWVDDETGSQSVKAEPAKKTAAPRKTTSKKK